MHKQILLVLRHASRWSNYRGVGVTHEMILEIFTLYLDVIVRLSLQWRLFPPPGCLLAPSTFSTPTPNTRSLSRPASQPPIWKPKTTRGRSFKRGRACPQQLWLDACPCHFEPHLGWRSNLKHNAYVLRVEKWFQLKGVLRSDVSTK